MAIFGCMILSWGHFIQRTLRSSPLLLCASEGCIRWGALLLVLAASEECSSFSGTIRCAPSSPP